MSKSQSILAVYLTSEEPSVPAAPPAAVIAAGIIMIVAAAALALAIAVVRRHLPASNGKFRVLIEWDHDTGNQMLVTCRRDDFTRGLLRDIVGYTRRDTLHGPKYCEFATLTEAKDQARWNVTNGVDQTGRTINGRVTAHIQQRGRGHWTTIEDSIR